MPEKQKDYSSISPSAKSLLLMKGYTNIPYAKETAALMQGPEIFNLDFDNKDFWFWIRVMHFESRYWSIDQLLKQTDARNILELSSGYSLRGLALCVHNENIHYIDTDLPEVISTKRDMISRLHLDASVKGRLELLPLNAMDEPAFNAIVQRFDKGPLTIVNEGLLMYLNTEEKQKLCKMIHGVLKERGGCWITADIYIKLPAEVQANMPKSSSEASFLEQHNLEENKFESYEAAKAFFESQGFALVKEAEQDFDKLSSLPNLIKVLPEEMRKSKNPPPKIQATWMLKAV
jgi:O-methyltransferase involved in polyketide biosynthesis